MNHLKMKLSPDATLEQIISRSRPALELLNSIGLNVSAQPEKTLRQVCAEKQWSEDEVLNWIKKNDTTETSMPPGNELLKKVSGRKIPFICNMLSGKSCPTLKKQNSDISLKYSRISKVHDSQYLWLKEAEWNVKLLTEKLSLYLQFEKQKFFPLAKELHVRKQRILDGDAQNLKRSIQLIEEDHQRFLDSIKTIRRMSNNFSIDNSACSSLRILCKQFRDLFGSLEEHISVEQKELLPKIRQELEEI